MPDWLTTGSLRDDVWIGAASAVLIYAAVIALCRLQGVRSFAKMSSFDFAMTIAVGSVIASTALTPDPPVLRGLVVLIVLFTAQWLVAKARIHLPGASRAVDNQPILIMRGPDILHDNLARASMTQDDLRAKLREANVLQLDQVRAVVAEATGDVSVLHANDPDDTLNDALLKDVRQP